MGWSLCYDHNWSRDIGYGVPAYCDYPGCYEEIHRGLYYVCCGEQPYGGEEGCGLYFCSNHLRTHDRDDTNAEFMCERCAEAKEPFCPKPDHPTWVRHKLTDDSWADWRAENPKWVEQHKCMFHSGDECKE